MSSVSKNKRFLKTDAFSYRRKCLKHKRHECYNCGYDHYVQVHHIDGDRGNNSLDNLLPLCHSCHSNVHSTLPTNDEYILKLRELLNVKVWEAEPNHPVYNEGEHLPVEPVKTVVEWCECQRAMSDVCPKCDNGKVVKTKLNSKHPTWNND